MALVMRVFIADLDRELRRQETLLELCFQYRHWYCFNVLIVVVEPCLCDWTDVAEHRQATEQVCAFDKDAMLPSFVD